MSIYREEFFSEALINEIAPLTVLSWEEANCSPGTPYDPDWDKYTALNEMDLLRLFTVRNDKDELVGYVTFMVSSTLHSKDITQALHDSMFILKPYRKSGVAKALLEYTEKEFKSEGIDMIIMMVMCHRDYSSTLKALGYKQTEMTFIKRPS